MVFTMVLRKRQQLFALRRVFGYCRNSIGLIDIEQFIYIETCTIRLPNPEFVAV